MKVSIAILETLVSKKLVTPMEHGWKRLLSSDRCVLSHDAARSNGRFCGKLSIQVRMAKPCLGTKLQIFRLVADTI
jgi:hypothetical protein